MALTPNEAYAAKQPFVDKETLEHIVEQFPTPFHLYDEAGIRRNMQEVRDAFAWNPGFKEYFAVKANPNPALISILNEYGCRSSTHRSSQRNTIRSWQRPWA
mgnify:CR=1 FL=1